MPGSDGRPAPTLSVAGGETTLITKALWVHPPAPPTPPHKAMWVESGSHAGAAMSPVVSVVVAAVPVRLRMRRLIISGSCRRYAMRFPAGAHDAALTGAVSTAS